MYRTPKTSRPTSRLPPRHHPVIRRVSSNAHSPATLFTVSLLHNLSCALSAPVCLQSLLLHHHKKPTISTYQLIAMVLKTSADGEFDGADEYNTHGKRMGSKFLDVWRNKRRKGTFFATTAVNSLTSLQGLESFHLKMTSLVRQVSKVRMENAKSRNCPWTGLGQRSPTKDAKVLL